MGQLSSNTFKSHMEGGVVTTSHDTNAAISKAAGEYCQPKNNINDNGKTIVITDGIKIERHGENIHIPGKMQKVEYFEKSGSNIISNTFNSLVGKMINTYNSSNSFNIINISKTDTMQKIYNDAPPSMREAIDKTISDYGINKSEMFDHCKIRPQYYDNGFIKINIIIDSKNDDRSTKIIYAREHTQNPYLQLKSINSNIRNCDNLCNTFSNKIDSIDNQIKNINYKIEQNKISNISNKELENKKGELEMIKTQFCYRFDHAEFKKEDLMERKRELFK